VQALARALQSPSQTVCRLDGAPDVLPGLIRRLPDAFVQLSNAAKGASLRTDFAASLPKDKAPAQPAVYLITTTTQPSETREYFKTAASKNHLPTKCLQKRLSDACALPDGPSNTLHLHYAGLVSLSCSLSRLSHAQPRKPVGSANIRR
jgi:hypothetical protein